jgi:hypothetical protein
MKVVLFFSEADHDTNLRGPEAERDWKANGSYRSFRQVVSEGGGGRMSSSLSMAGKRARGGVVCCNANFELINLLCKVFAYIASHEDPERCAKMGWILAKSNFRYLSVTFQ